jgi:hypothetical protein
MVDLDKRLRDTQAAKAAVEARVKELEHVLTYEKGMEVSCKC